MIEFSLGQEGDYRQSTGKTPVIEIPLDGTWYKGVLDFYQRIDGILSMSETVDELRILQVGMEAIKKALVEDLVISGQDPKAHSLPPHCMIKIINRDNPRR